MKYGYFFRKKWGLFVKLFLSLLLVMVIPTVVATVLNYNISKQNLEDEVGQSNLDVLRQTREAVDTIMGHTENITYQLYRNQQLQHFVANSYDLDDYDEVQKIDTLMNMLESIMEGSPYISGIHMYSLENQMLVSSNGFNQETLLEGHEQFYQELEQHPEGLWLEPGKQGVFEEPHPPLQFIKAIFNSSQSLAGYFVVQLSSDEFTTLIQDLYIRRSGSVFMVNSAGEVIMNRQTPSILIRNEALMGELFSSEQEGVTIVKEDWPGESWIVSFTGSRLNGWKYVAAVPTDELEHKSGAIYRNMMIAIIILTTVSVVLALSMARGLYNPIRSLKSMLSGEALNERQQRHLFLRTDEIGIINRKITEMSHQLERSIPKLKHYFLFRLAAGEHFEPGELRAQAATYELPLQGQYIVILLQVGARSVMDWEDETHAGDSMRSSLRTLFMDRMKLMMTFDAFYEQSDKLIGIGIMPQEQDTDEWLAQLKNSCSEFLVSVRELIGTEICISAGLPCAGLDRLHQSYNDAEWAMKYKFILGANSVIMGRDLIRAKQEAQLSHDYPQVIKASLYAKKYDQAAKILRELQSMLKNNLHSKIEFTFFYRQIIQIVVQYLNESNQAKTKWVDPLNRAFLHLESEYRDIDEATDSIAHMLEEIAHENESPAVMNSYIEQTLDMIRNEYQKDLSLTEIADRLSVSYPYLSKLFKEELGKNFKEYLTEYKLEQAKQLLSSTTLPIEQVALQVGYNNYKQFSRMFKKYEMVTPMDYRQMMTME
ncbi:helix-turn-helix domain-containing protein [Paenibacillus sp. PL2-23]|uniref:helix-turn-helix domain-containing protein n=1 Tax=Paenibacillus sp. PL2-23 TaxID=2100729 RepID=UPI0030FC61F3